jgi:hypothetical protein
LSAALSRAEIARLDTWISAVAAYLKPEDAAEYDGAELRFGSLCLSADGKWYRWSASKGGRGALSLIVHLRGCSELEAVFWARQWLSAHPGDGEALHSISDHDKAARRTTNLERILTESIEDTSGTAAEAYLRGRGLAPLSVERTLLAGLAHRRARDGVPAHRCSGRGDRRAGCQRRPARPQEHGSACQKDVHAQARASSGASAAL